MVFDPSSLLKIMGLDPDLITEEALKLKAIAADIDARMRRIEERQDHIVGLLETLHDSMATQHVLLNAYREHCRNCGVWDNKIQAAIHDDTKIC